MKHLTEKEKELMSIFWYKGKLFVKELLEYFPEPKPHINTVSTIVRILEQKGFLGHEPVNKSYRYFPLVTEKQYRSRSLKQVIANYFDNSYLGAVSALIEEQDLSIDDLKELIKKVEKGG